MVANLTLGKKKYAGVEDAMRLVRTEAAALHQTLMSLARRDSEAFEAVLAARRLPQATTEEQQTRAATVAKAELEAARVPLATAESCLRVVELAERAAKQGNVNAVSDAGVAGQIASAAAEGALLNVEINLKSLTPSGAGQDLGARVVELREELARTAARCRQAVRAALDD
jgi:glutamate formiminotransferase/formiminotetrahydrofolate cyclodeaminase